MRPLANNVLNKREECILDCLLEALRRYNAFHLGDGLTIAWLGLGCNSAYRDGLKDGYFTPVHKDSQYFRSPRWWRLTEKGADFVKHIMLSGGEWQSNDYPFSLNFVFPGMSAQMSMNHARYLFRNYHDEYHDRIKSRRPRANKSA